MIVWGWGPKTSERPLNYAFRDPEREHSAVTDRIPPRQERLSSFLAGVTAAGTPGRKPPSMRLFTVRSLALATLVPALLLFVLVPGCAKQSEGERCGDDVYGPDSDDCSDGLTCTNYKALLSGATDSTHRCCYADHVSNSRCEPAGTAPIGEMGGGGGAETAGGGGAGTAGGGVAGGSPVGDAGTGGGG